MGLYRNRLASVQAMARCQCLLGTRSWSLSSGIRQTWIWSHALPPTTYEILSFHFWCVCHRLCIFVPVLLGYNFHITMYKFKVYLRFLKFYISLGFSLCLIGMLTTQSLVQSNCSVQSCNNHFFIISLWVHADLSFRVPSWPYSSWEREAVYWAVTICPSLPRLSLWSEVKYDGGKGDPSGFSYEQDEEMALCQNHKFATSLLW